MNDDALFFAQYHQIWSQKRHHDNHIWATPALSITVLTLVVSRLHFSALTGWSRSLSLPAAGLFLIGIARLHLRHVFFETAYSLLLRDMDREMPHQRQPLQPVPQPCDDKMLYRMFEDELHGSAKLGAGCRWETTCFFIVASLVLFLLIFVDATNPGRVYSDFLKNLLS